MRDGFADLRAPPRGELPSGRAGPGLVEGPAPADDDARLVALLGISRGPGTVVLVGRPARYAGRVAEAVEEIQVVALDPDTRAWPDHAGVSRMVASPGLPFFSRMLRGVVVDGALGRATLFEAARVTAPMSRVVVTDAPDDAREVLEEAGLSILAAESGTVVATRG